MKETLILIGPYIQRQAQSEVGLRASFLGCLFLIFLCLTRVILKHTSS